MSLFEGSPKGGGPGSSLPTWSGPSGMTIMGLVLFLVIISGHVGRMESSISYDMEIKVNYGN